ncbi:MAG: hypothetical protein GKR77_03105 [Legionellales bacterium]|nr:hypothetical protein [Legionellales bacterium]
MSDRVTTVSKVDMNLEKARRILVDECSPSEEFKLEIPSVKQLENNNYGDNPICETVLTRAEQFYAVMAPGQRGKNHGYQEDAFSYQTFPNTEIFEQNPEDLTSVIAGAVQDYAAIMEDSLAADTELCLGTTLSLAVQVSTPQKTELHTLNLGDCLTLLATRKKGSTDAWALTPLNWQHHPSDQEEQTRIKQQGGSLRYQFPNKGDLITELTASSYHLDINKATHTFLVDARRKNIIGVSRSIGDVDIRGHSYQPSSTRISVDHQQNEGILLQLTDGIFATNPKEGLTLQQIETLINQPNFRNNSDHWGALLTLVVEQSNERNERNECNAIANDDNKTILVTTLHPNSAVTISCVADEHRSRTAECQDEDYKESGSLSSQVVREVPNKIIQYLQYPKQIGPCIAKIEAHSFDLKYGGGNLITINGQSKKVSKIASEVHQILTNQTLTGAQRIEQAIPLLTFKQKISSNRVLRFFNRRHTTTELFYKNLLKTMQDSSSPSDSQQQQGLSSS